MDIKKHLNIIGILLIVEATLGLMGAGYLGIMVMVFSCGAMDAQQIQCLLRGIGAFLILALCFSLLPTLGYIWLKKHLWIGRNLLIVYSALLLINFPIGTAAAIYQLIILTKLTRQGKQFVGD